MCTISGNADTVVVAWMESSGGNPEIMHALFVLRVSRAFGAVLGECHGNGIAGQQSFPDIFWKNGRVHLVWQDDATNRVMYRTAVVGIPTGIEGNPFESWSMFPNPSNGLVSLRNLPSGKLTLRLMNARRANIVSVGVG
jgi:hypothetical protein